MVRIDDAQAEEIKYIISQSMNGLHVLFDNDTIKRYLNRSESNEDEVFNEKKSRETEKLIERFMSTPTITGKKMLFQSLTDEEKALLIKTYFSIVENNILNSRRLIN
ncbi:MAG: hypothetical protein NTY22_07455 [Proteobacteria bacterium]|nr:hypothetical protein [Pseudomonadota bacterium]